MSSANLSGVNFTNQKWSHEKCLSHVSICLKNEGLKSILNMQTYLEGRGHYSGYRNPEVYYAKLENGTECVIKVDPKGTPGLARAEALAYKAYESCIAPYTNNHFVPPTVVREFSGREASFQYFVRTNNGREDFWDESYRAMVFRQSNPQDTQEMAVFQSVFGRWDNHLGSTLATFNERGKVQFALVNNKSISDRTMLPQFGERPLLRLPIKINPPVNIEPCQYFDLKTGNPEELRSEISKIGVNFNNALCERVCSYMKQNGGMFNMFAVRGNEFYVHTKPSSNKFPLPTGPFLKSISGAYAALSSYPIPEGPIPESLIEAYKGLDLQALSNLYGPLNQISYDKFGKLAEDVIERRNQFLNFALQAN